MAPEAATAAVAMEAATEAARVAAATAVARAEVRAAAAMEGVTEEATEAAATEVARGVEAAKAADRTTLGGATRRAPQFLPTWRVACLRVWAGDTRVPVIRLAQQRHAPTSRLRTCSLLPLARRLPFVSLKRMQNCR